MNGLFRTASCLSVVIATACTPTVTPQNQDLGKNADQGANIDQGAADQKLAPDLSNVSTVGIACGATNCVTTAQFCCTSDEGKTGDCQAEQSPTCGYSYFHCDGPEDCPPAMSECCVSNGSATCRPVGECGTLPMVAYVMCHQASDCGTGTFYCCHAPSSPYALCFTSPCP